MSESASGSNEAAQAQSLAQTVFSSMSHEDPVFLELKSLLMHGRRSEALSLIHRYDNRLQDPQAQELVSLIMNTLSDTMIDP